MGSAPLSAGMEWLPTGARAVVGTINSYCYTLGQFVLAAVAFSVPHWRWLQLIVSLPFFLFFLYSWYGEPRGPGGRPPSSSSWAGGQGGGCWGVCVPQLGDGGQGGPQRVMGCVGWVQGPPVSPLLSPQGSLWSQPGGR